jgi:Ca2+-binding EF-hand superfamily protein
MLGDLAFIILLRLLVTADLDATAERGHQEAGWIARIDPGLLLGSAIERGWTQRPEWAEMLAAILKDEALHDGKGWWRPSRGRHDWAWLAESFDADRSGAIERRELPREEIAFERLDGDGDGRISEEDLKGDRDREEWGLARALFRRLDADHNERVSWDELSWLFQEADRKKRGSITLEDLEAVLAKPAPDQAMPSRWQFLGMFFRGELGSFREGPALGAPAPDFELLRRGGGPVVRLSDSRGKRPVVLIFGSFT